jgi:L-fuconolactonase
MYRYDASYAVEVQRAHPGRFAIVKPVDPDDPAVADVIADWKKTPGAVGIRIMLTKEAKRAPDDPASTGSRARPCARFSGQHPVLGQPRRGTALIDRHPDTRFIIDHLAILQPRVPPAPPQPWADLPKVLELAKRKNAVIKVSGACTLSRSRIRSRTSGIRSPACSMPGVSSAACGARTGRAPSRSSTTSRPSSRSSRPTA